MTKKATALEHTGQASDPPSGAFEDRMLLDGELQRGAAVPVRVLSPSTGEVLADVPTASVDQFNVAIRAARRAFDGGWGSASGATRAAALTRMADQFERVADDVLACAVNEVGTPVSTARALHVEGPIGVLRHFAELATIDRTQELGRHTGPPVSESRVQYIPAGLSLGIAAYNYPVMLGLNKAAAALAAGCTHIWLPSPRTPLTTSLLAAAFQEADLPPGVLQMIIGDVDLARYATSCGSFDRISFTGSVDVGRAILRQSARELPGLVLELGGKSGNVILPGFSYSAESVLSMHLRYARNAGQGCMSPTRLIVPHEDMDEFLTASQAAYEKIVVGDPWDPATHVGPLISKEHREHVEGVVERAVQNGAQIVAGGGRPRGERGWYINPHLVTNVDSSDEIAAQEIFGPVAVVLGYDSIDQAVALANDTSYGLAAYIAGPDLSQCLALASRMRAGSVYIQGGGGSRPDVPIGGLRRSGFGREKGEWGIREFLEAQHVQWRVDG